MCKSSLSPPTCDCPSLHPGLIEDRPATQVACIINNNVHLLTVAHAPNNRSGFSVPITCTCEDDTITFGCSIDLFAEGECPDTCDDGPCLQGATCRNPLRYLDEDGLTAAPFFMPCQGKAFTWARDDANSQNSRCTSNYISCCIGTEADGCPSTT